MKHYILYLSILPVHHPNKTLSTLDPPLPVLETLYVTLRKEQEKATQEASSCKAKTKTKGILVLPCNTEYVSTKEKTHSAFNCKTSSITTIKILANSLTLLILCSGTN